MAEDETLNMTVPARSMYPGTIAGRTGTERQAPCLLENTCKNVPGHFCAEACNTLPSTMRHFKRGLL
jgi:hypothetical protein